MPLLATIRDFVSRPMVRPWALSAPILVLLLCLPMLRPLRHPADISDDEAMRLATISSLSQRGTLALSAVPAHLTSDLPPIVRVDDRVYADQPPVLAVLLAWPTSLMSRFGLSLQTNPAVVTYILTLLAVTLPVAGAAGLLYRMGRLFELSRPWRAALASAVVFGSGLISYAVVLNPHAPAAVLLLCSAACMIHVSLSKLPKRGIAWILLAGICAALAAALDPPAGLIAILFFFVIATLRMPLQYRAAAMLLFLIGTAGPIALHAAWSKPVTGEMIPGWNHAKRLLGSASFARQPSSEIEEPDADDVIAPASSRWSMQASWWLDALGGPHGLLTHFPVLLLGILGVGAVMHRHWPSFVKSLAAATVIGAILVISFYAAARTDWHGAMFASRWFVVFLPLVLFWSGAWLRRAHSSLTWSIAGALLAFSVIVAVIGMTEPYPPEGFDRYTAGAALHRMIHPPVPGSSASARTTPSIVAR